MNNEYRKILLKAANELSLLKSKMKDIRESGLDKERQASDRRVAVEEHKKKLELELLVMKKLTESIYIDSLKNAETIRRGGRADTNEQLFHQQRAAMSLRGLEPNEAIETFDNMIHTLTDKEKNHRWIYEDVLRSAVRDIEYSDKMNQAIDRHRTDEERDALKEARVMQAMVQSDQTFRGLLELDFNKLDESGHCGDYDYNLFMDEALKVARRQESDLNNLKTPKEAITEIEKKRQ